MKSKKICVIGLGYVGLPLAIEFGKKYETLGFDLDNQRIQNLNKKKDLNDQVKKKDFIESKKLNFSSNKKAIKNYNIFIVTVPTPVNKNKSPNLKSLIDATKLVAMQLKANDIVIYESTVYPGVTEEICVPLLKKISGLNSDKDSKSSYFSYGFSPERLNPGSKQSDIKKIIKITSGSTKKSSAIIDNLYKSIISAGTHKAKSVKIAEAAKIIENTQRDLNIGLINEFQKIFNKMGLDTSEILKAAGTKWNFLKFRPGLVGGHCISVDPYYLSYKAKQIGVNPKMVLAGRQTNSSMPKFYCDKILQNIKKKKLKILIMGLTFKENCPDIRNSGSIEMCKIFLKKNIILDSYDPNISKKDVSSLKYINYVREPRKKFYDIVIVTVAHKNFKKLDKVYFEGILKNKNSAIFDLKSILNKKVPKKII
jgi:UDP-N-acetyl-D-glucosamine/UDP-N-acetyl-D-galactosamine dehydrogenase